ncbi:MAG TPA: redoxin family protein [Pseudonocardiaceae bacterium]|nr:redoxin family protein [Pseudonocardiaceae bacterium]
MTPPFRLAFGRAARNSTIGAAVIAVVAAGPLLAACGTNTLGGSPNAAAAGSTATTVTTVATVAGRTVHVPGDKPTALFFFTVGCGECAVGARSLAQVARAAHGNADVLAVDMDPSESTQDISGFLTSVDAAGLPAAIDTGAALTQRFGIGALSTLIVIDPSGSVTYRATDPSAQAITTALHHAGAR